jgi:hypothetical protein
MQKSRWCVGAVCASLMAIAGANAQQISPTMPVDVANLPAPSATDWAELAWQSFVAANWPVTSGMLGVPDPNQRIGAVDPAGMPLLVLWMTSKSPNDVFVAAGEVPSSDWQSRVPAAACQGVPGYDPKTSYVLTMVSKTSGPAFTEINQAPFPGSKQVVGPVIDQAGRYARFDIRMSQSEFAYLIYFKYYSATEQNAAVNAIPPTFESPPRSGQEPYLQLPDYARYGTVEYKASWRELDPRVDILSRYFRAQAFIVDPDGTCRGPQLMGLTGLHLLRLTPSTPRTWYWATFEQVDNLTVPQPPPQRPDGQPLTPSFGDGKNFPAGYDAMPPPVVPGQPLPPNPNPVDVSRVTPIHSDAGPVTHAYQQALAGTVWQNYLLVGTQFPVNPQYNGQTQGSAKGVGECYAAGPNHAADPAFQINDCYLSNVTMETYVQSTSCVTCHSFGAPRGVSLATTSPTPRPTFNALSKFQIFSFMLLQAQCPTPAPSWCVH